MCKGYYSPRIKKDYITVLYLMAKEEKIPMTQLVNKFIAEALSLLIERRAKHGKKGGDNHQGITGAFSRNQNQT
jgi:hypothetical protein